MVAQLKHYLSIETVSFIERQKVCCISPKIPILVYHYRQKDGQSKYYCWKRQMCCTHIWELIWPLKTLNHSVTEGINTLCALRHLPDEASATAKFIKTFDQLFNAFISAGRTSNLKYKNALSETKGHTAFLNSCLRFLLKLKTGENILVPYIVGWRVSVISLLGLWIDLHDTGFPNNMLCQTWQGTS